MSNNAVVLVSVGFKLFDEYPHNAKICTLQKNGRLVILINHKNLSKQLTSRDCVFLRGIFIIIQYK